MRIINDIINKEVVNGEAMTIGKVVDIEIDTAENAIESLRIVKKKGRRKSSEEIKIPFEEVSRIRDMILIRKSFEKSFI